MNMLKKIVLVLCLAIPVLPLSAQWAGEDITLLKHEQNGQNVKHVYIQLNEYNPDYCYKWRGPSITIDGDKIIEVCPQAEYETYTCIRYSENGVDEDQVKIHMVDSITINVECKQSCYSPGDVVSIDDFIISTYPEEYASQVEIVGPTDIEYKYTTTGSYIKTITFQVEAYDITFRKTYDINVIDEAFQLTITSPKLNAIIEGMAEMQKIVNKLETCKNKFEKFDFLRKLAEAPSSPVSFVHGITIAQVNFTPSHKECCNGQETEFTTVSWGGLDGYAGIEVSLPFNTPIPGLQALLELGLKAHVNIGTFTGRVATTEDCSEAVVGITASIVANGAVGVAILSPNILKATLGIQGAATVGAYYNLFSHEVEYPPLLVEVKLVGLVQELGTFEQSVSWTIMKEYFNLN